MKEENMKTVILQKEQIWKRDWICGFGILPLVFQKTIAEFMFCVMNKKKSINLEF